MEHYLIPRLVDAVPEAFVNSLPCRIQARTYKYGQELMVGLWVFENPWDRAACQLPTGTCKDTTNPQYELKLGSTGGNGKT
jgi:hypothetical protein